MDGTCTNVPEPAGRGQRSRLDPARRQVPRFGEHPPDHRFEHIDRLGGVVGIERGLVVAFAELSRELEALSFALEASLRPG